MPVVRLEHLSPAQVRAYRIADNRIAELSDWDEELLRLEIVDLSDLDLKGEPGFDLSLTGFDMPPLDIILEGGATNKEETERVDLPDAETPAITRPGDIRRLGEHRLLCGNALEAGNHARLMGEVRICMVFADPPHNCPVEGHVRAGSGHREFAMGVGADRLDGRIARGVACGPRTRWSAPNTLPAPDTLHRETIPLWSRSGRPRTYPGERELRVGNEPLRPGNSAKVACRP